MKDRFSKQALIRELTQAHKRNEQLEGIINAMVAKLGRVFVSQEDHDAAQRGRVSIRFDAERSGLVLQYYDMHAKPERSKGPLAKLVALVGGGAMATKAEPDVEPER